MVHITKVSKVGHWPVAWEITVDHDKVEDDAIEKMFFEMNSDLEEIDGTYYRHAVEKAEWESIVRGIERICGEEAGGAVTKFVTCICIGVMDSPADGSARRIGKEVLESANSSTKKINRKVEWAVSSLNEKVFLEINPRKAYAKWVANDREKLRRQESNLRKNKMRNLANTGMAFGWLGWGMARNAMVPRSKSMTPKVKSKRGYTRSPPQLAISESPGMALETLHDKQLISDEEYEKIKLRMAA